MWVTGSWWCQLTSGLQEADNVSKHVSHRKLTMSVNRYVTGKQEADDTSKYVGYTKLTMSVNMSVTGGWQYQ